MEILLKFSETNPNAVHIKQKGDIDGIPFFVEDLKKGGNSYSINKVDTLDVSELYTHKFDERIQQRTSGDLK